MGAVEPRGVSRLVLCLSLLLGACGPGAASPTSAICDGIAAEMGGCGEDLPAFTADDCDGVAREWGRQIDSQVRAIISGPDAVDGEARSVRIKQAAVLLSALAGRHLDDVGVRAQCDATEFLEIGEGEFSDELRERVGGAMFDGEPVVPYEEWLADLARTARSIEDD